MADIQTAIQQGRFVNAAHELRANLRFTASWFQEQMGLFLKPYELTPAQFNALRILRGQQRIAQEQVGSETGSFSTADLRARMVDRASDTPRLVQRLEASGLVHKKPCDHDGRRVHLTITEEGLNLLAEIDKHMAELDEVMANLSNDEIGQLNRLLDKLRGE